MTAHDPLATRLTDLLGCRLPVLQAGMGGVARSELVAASGRAGAYGFLGMVREPAALIAAEIDAVRAASDAPFGVNLIPCATDPELLRDELAICFERGVHSVCYFWDVDPAAVAWAKDAGCLVFYQVGSLEDAVAAEAAGADVIIAQGFEAGGHVRGSVTSLVLLPQVVAAVSVPVVGSGGFGTGASLAAALALGAEGVHCGTAFLATEESFAHDLHKQKVAEAASADTIHTDGFAINWPAGSPVRVLANATSAALGERLYGYGPDDFPRETIAWEEQRPLYRFSTDSPLRNMTGALDELALFAGQIAGSLNGITTVAQRLDAMEREARQCLGRFNPETGPTA